MWLEAQENPQGLPAQQGTQGLQPEPTSQPVQTSATNQTNQPEQPEQPEQSGLEPTPDVPENNDEIEFNTWRNEFFKLAVCGDTDKMIDSINEIKDQNLDSAQMKFVDDNLKILLLRQDANFDKVSKNIRKSLKTDLDQSHPGVSLLQVISPEVNSNPVLNEIIIKLFGFHGLKGELHRKFIAALTGSIQVGGGGEKEDLVFNEKEYSINISTRMAGSFGEITIGKWSLKENDASKFLAEPEMTRLQEGSPEEKKALAHRIVLDSIAEKFKTRAFFIQVVTVDGNVYSIGWDIGESLKDAYRDGKLIIKSDMSSDSDAFIGEDGKIIALKNIGIYAKSGDENEQKEMPFIENRSGILYFTADLDTMNSIGSSISGMMFQSQPFTGSPEQFRELTRATPDLATLLLRR